MGNFDYVRPESLEEAIECLADGEGRVLAGGTDLVLHLKQGKLRPRRIVDINRIPALHDLREEDGRIVLGAGITFAELAISPVVLRHAQPLAQAALQIGSPQIQNVATVGGNIAHGSPAADGVVPLLALGTRLLIRSLRGTSRAELSSLIETEQGKVALDPDQLIVWMEFPKLDPSTRSIYLKLGRRNEVTIARLSLCAVALVSPQGTIERAAISIGAAGPHPFRLVSAERLLLGVRPTPELIKETVDEISGEVSHSLWDRPSAPYKSYAIRGLAREALEYCLGFGSDGGE
jgi:CO/xanthine dehydrogenase FAD-binding subunit